MSSADEAIARAKAIAARLAGTPAVAAISPSVVQSGDLSAPAAAVPAPTATPAAAGGEGGAVDAATVAAAESALEAAFGGVSPQAGGSGSGTKRKRWSVDDSGGGGGELLPGLEEAEKRKRLGGEAGDTGSVKKKIWIPTGQNPGYNYVGLLIGPGGAKQRELVEKAGGKVKISIRGSSTSGGGGTSSTPLDAANEPLHVLLEGDPICVQNAEEMITDLLSDTAKADLEKGRQLAEVMAAKNAGSTAPSTSAPASGVAGHYGPAGGAAPDTGGAPSASDSSTPSSSSYKPAPVAHLIGQAIAGPATSAAGAYGPGGATASAETVEEKIGVPNGVVGYIIGKGGESITKMQRTSGCRVQIQKEHEMEPGSTQRVITLTAATKESIAACRAIIEGMVNDRLRMTEQRTSAPGTGAMGGGGGGANAAAQAAQLQQAIAEGQHLLTVQVPNNDVGLIIGKGGITIRSIQDRSGANVQVPQHGDADNPLIRTVSVTHPSADGATFAKQLIEDILKKKLGNNFLGAVTGGAPAAMSAGPAPGMENEPGTNPGDVSIQVHIPDKDVGMVIGRGGCVIREMQNKTMTRIQIPSHPTPGQPSRTATISGSPGGCEQVKSMIERMVMEQSSQSVMTGAAFTENFNQYAQQQMTQGIYSQQYGQQAYGQQYGAYGQQYAAAQGYGQAATTTQQAAGGQKTDYSAEWAAYYAAQQQQGAASAAGAAAAATRSSTAAAPSPASGASSSNPVATGASSAGTDANGQPLAADSYYDAFFRYAVYYGEEAARKYYGAWSPPAGTPNPYGSSGGATATTPVAAPDGQAQDNAASDDVKDSSARKLSNLPAWMTKN